MINIVCVLKSKPSSIYNEEWVYKLQRAISRNLSLPYKFICLTDIPLDCDHIFLDERDSGWWNKIQLFKPGLFVEETLYFDLDVVITKPLDSLILNLRNSKETFFMCQEPSGIANSSIMYWKESMDSLFVTYEKSPADFHHTYSSLPKYGDQGFISDNSNHSFIEEHLPNNYIAWTDSHALNDTVDTGIIVFTSIKSKPSKKIFALTEIIKTHWI
jgi:hypothetical protein